MKTKDDELVKSRKFAKFDGIVKSTGGKASRIVRNEAYLGVHRNDERFAQRSMRTFYEVVKEISRIALAFLFITLGAIMLPRQASGLTVGEITNGFACTCGCNMVVSACGGSMTCDAAKNISAEVDRLINQGRSKGQIVQYFTGKYGERILAAPTKKGFNLAAWILPFVALLFGAGVIYFFIERCLRSAGRRGEDADGSSSSGPEEKKYFDQLEKELNNFEP